MPYIAEATSALQRKTDAMMVMLGKTQAELSSNFIIVHGKNRMKGKPFHDHMTNLIKLLESDQSLKHRWTNICAPVDEYTKSIIIVKSYKDRSSFCIDLAKAFNTKDIGFTWHTTPNLFTFCQPAKRALSS